MRITTLLISLICVFIATASLNAENISYTEYFTSDTMLTDNGWSFAESSDVTYSYHYEADGMNVTDVNAGIADWQNFGVYKILDRTITGDFTASVYFDWNSLDESSNPAPEFMSDITFALYGWETEIFRAEYIDYRATDFGELVIRTNQSGRFDQTDPGVLPATGSGILSYTRVGNQLTVRSEAGAQSAEYTFTLNSDDEIAVLHISFAGNSNGDFGSIKLKSLEFSGEVEGAAIPEPASLALIAIGITGLIRRKFRR